MEALGLTWLPDYTARVVGNSQLIEIAVTDTIPERAQAVANELVNQLILLSPENPDRNDSQRQTFITRQLDDLEVKIEETQDEIASKQADLANLFSARQIAETQTLIEGLQDKLGSLQSNYAALLASTQAGAVNTITLIEAPALPAIPIGPNRMAAILLAAAGGFAVALAAAYLLEYLDDTLKNPEDVDSALGLATLGAVPRARGALRGDDRDLIVARSSASPETEAYRVLRTNLQFASVKHPVRTLLVASSTPGEGKSLTAANLAAALAQAGKKVILVDTDLHRPRLHKLFQLRDSTGLTTLLLEETPELEPVLQPTVVPGLEVLPSGPLPPNAAELLGSERMRELLRQLRSRADYVVLDSPPVVALSDAAILATLCDGVLLVVAAGRTRRSEARRAIAALRQVDARVLGVVLNKMPKAHKGTYYYYYDYGYGYSRDAGKGDRKPKRSQQTRAVPQVVAVEPGRNGKYDAMPAGQQDLHGS
jgi:non-specific protein-tyrosine kinase